MDFAKKEHIENTDLLKLIEKQIDYCRSGSSSFPGVVSKIDTYIAGLDEFNKKVSDSLRDKWRVLEEVNALALDEGQAKPLDEHLELVESTLQDMISIIAQRV